MRQSKETDADVSAGYYYIILDDCWSDGRTSNGTLQANVTKFPDGIPAVAEKVHGMGLGWGMYSSAGKYTCAQYGTVLCSASLQL